ncbi:MAG: hypothetical protein M3375_01355 [Actinomycetota bacterium]|nr:hypothetical protein [Actinomycetota bacterium]
MSIEEVPEIKFGNKGPLIRIRDEQGQNIGKLRIGQATVRWAKGSVPEKNAKTVSVEEFVKYLDSL